MGLEAIFFEYHEYAVESWREIAARDRAEIRLESTRFSLGTSLTPTPHFVFVFGQLLMLQVPRAVSNAMIGSVRRWRYFPNGRYVGESFFTATCRLISVRQRRNMIRVVLEPLDPWLEDKVR